MRCVRPNINIKRTKFYYCLDHLAGKQSDIFKRDVLPYKLLQQRSCYGVLEKFPEILLYCREITGSY